MYGDARRGNLAAHNAGNPFGGGGFAPDPTGGAYIAPPEPLAGGEGVAVLSPRIPPLLSALELWPSPVPPLQN